MILYHGTADTISTLDPDSFLTACAAEAIGYAERRHGKRIYVFKVRKNQVRKYRRHFKSNRPLKPLACFTIESNDYAGRD